MVRTAIAFLSACCLLAGSQAPAELDRIEKSIQSLTELKTRVQEIETEIDRLLTELSEQKGLLQARPSQPAKGWANIPDIEPDRKPVVGRCAAITSKGGRCTRPAVQGGRYCKQHQIAHSK
jgi:hypothetical protein